MPVVYRTGCISTKLWTSSDTLFKSPIGKLNYCPFFTIRTLGFGGKVPLIDKIHLLWHNSYQYPSIRINESPYLCRFHLSSSSEPSYSIALHNAILEDDIFDFSQVLPSLHLHTPHEYSFAKNCRGSNTCFIT